MRQQFNVGQEIVSEDLNSLQSRLERGIYDRIIYELINRKSDGFFQDGLKVVYQSSLEFVVKKGLGFQTADTGTKNPVKKPVVLDADVTMQINTPDSSNGRIDLLVVKASRFDAESENRKFKDEFTDTVTTQATVVATDWKADIVYVPGTPSGSPVAPAIPAGYMLVCSINVSASTGIADQAALEDERTLLPFAITTSATGSNEYDAVVGNVLMAGVTHGDLKSALDNASDGWKILILESEEIDTTPVVTKNDIELVFKRGATLEKGLAAIGLQVNGNDCKIVNARFLNFSVGGDNGLRINTGALRTYVQGARFANCATNTNDLGTQSFIDVEFTE